MTPDEGEVCQKYGANLPSTHSHEESSVANSTCACRTRTCVSNAPCVLGFRDDTLYSHDAFESDILTIAYNGVQYPGKPWQGAIEKYQGSTTVGPHWNDTVCDVMRPVADNRLRCKMPFGCAQGLYQDAIANTCEQCPIEIDQNLPDGTKCILCPAGRYGNTLEEKSGLFACEVGGYCSVGSSAVISCSAGAIDWLLTLMTRPCFGFAHTSFS